MSKRRRPLGDRGLGAHALSGLDRMTEQRPEHPSGRVLLPGQLGCGSHLAEDHALTEDRGVDTGRHVEQMRDRRVVDPAGEKLR